MKAMKEWETSARGSASDVESGGVAPRSQIGAGPWAAADMAARRNAIKNLFVERAPTTTIVEKIDKVRSDRDALSEPTCMLITGETGVGKSTSLRHYAAGHPSRREAGCLVQPIVYVELQSKMTLLAAAKALARELKDPSGGKGGLADLTFRVSDQLKAQRVEAVIFDEFQHIVETGEITVNKVADWHKQVTKESNIPFVMAGMPTAARVIDNHEQFSDITPYRYKLGNFEWASRAGRDAYREFLALVDKELPFDGVAGIADKETSRLLFDAVAGRMRPLMRLIKKAAIHALERGAANVGQGDLAYGYEQIVPADPQAENPFGSFATQAM